MGHQSRQLVGSIVKGRSLPEGLAVPSLARRTQLRMVVRVPMPCVAHDPPFRYAVVMKPARIPCGATGSRRVLLMPAAAGRQVRI